MPSASCASGGHTEVAFVWRGAQAGQGDATARVPTGELSRDAGKPAEAIAVLSPAAGSAGVRQVRLALLREAGRSGPAIAWLTDLAADGVTEAAKTLEGLLLDTGRADGAIASLRTRAAAGDGSPGRDLVTALASAGGHDEMTAWLASEPRVGVVRPREGGGRARRRGPSRRRSRSTGARPRRSRITRAGATSRPGCGRAGETIAGPRPR